MKEAQIGELICVQHSASEVAKTDFVRELKEAVNKSKAYAQALQLPSNILRIPEYLPTERLKAAENVSYDDILSLALSNASLQGLAVDAVIQGNFP